MKILKAITRFAREVIFGSPSRAQEESLRNVERDLDGYKYSQASIQRQGNGLGNGF